MRDLRGATLPGTAGRPNEDAFAILPSLAVIADGATSPPQLGDGCIHGPAWYARRLVAAVVTAHADDPAARPADLLAAAIASTTAAHADTCDISHPGTPSATVAVLTFRADGTVEWLVLGDCTLIIDAGRGVQVVSDDRLSNSSHVERAAVKTPGGAADPAEYSQRIADLVLAQRAHRNRPGGFWVAAAEPNAAYEAYTGTISAPPNGSAYRAAMLTDGASRIVDVYRSLTWEETLKVLEASGLADLLQQVRTAELNDVVASTYPRIKLSDDATAVFASWTDQNA
jgi:hypothetical protein